MDIYELTEFLKERNAGVEPTFEFNQSCMKRLEINFTNGQAGEYHHIEYDHVMVNEENKAPYRMKIANHREMVRKEDVEERFGFKMA